MTALIIRLTLLVTLIIVIVQEATYPSSIGNSFIQHLDKIIDFIVFGVIAVLFVTVISPSQASIPVYLLSAILAVMLGGAEEWIQSITPGRHAGLGDLIADACGVFVFLVLWKMRHTRVTSCQANAEDRFQRNDSVTQ